MNFPRLKNALLCRIFIYVVILGGFIAPIIIAANLKFLSETTKILIGVAFLIGLLIYLIKNFVVLMAMDTGLSLLYCHNTARKRFVLPRSFSVEKVEKRISRFGDASETTTIFPHPEMLQYKSSTPITIYSSGIEKVIATYHIESLDQGAYYSIINSAIVNSKALKGKKKPRFLDKSQKKSPLNRVTVIVIFAKRIDEKFKIRLFDTVCKNSGDGFDTSVLSCVLDLETQVCTFDSMRIPYMGFQYPAKNRGIRIIRKYLFNNRFPFTNSPDMLDPIKDFNPEQSLWSFWRTTKKELILEDKQNQKRFEKMAHREIVLEDDYLYLKWKDRGVWLSVEFNEELRTAEIDAIDSWDYPKINKISKDTIKELKNLIDAHFAQLGYTTKYISLDEYN